MIRILKKLISAPFILLAAIFIILEDWLWDDLARLVAFLGRLPVFRHFESFVVWLPPYPSLLLFAFPSVLLIPVKFLSLYFIANGQAVLGFSIAAGAKVIGTALVARIFNLTKPKLLRINWFKKVYGYVTDFKARIYGVIKSTWFYKLIHERKELLKTAFRNWKNARKSIWRKRWDAAKRYMRRAK